MSSDAERLQSAAEACFTQGFGGVLRVESSGDGSSLWIDGRPDVPTVSDRAPPEVAGRFCLWRGPVQVLSTILSGQRRLETAYTAGQLKISGDMAVMARLELGTSAP
ncbi:MAG: SCP2 sterol-binding domain-containing protein [Pseudomonadota bacterium]